MKIDAFNHILPPKFAKYIIENDNIKFATKSRMAGLAEVHDLDALFRLMDKFPDVKKVITLAVFNSMEEMTDNPKEAVELAKRANDEMAELVDKYPDRFVAAIAVLPLSNMDVTLRELDRAINELRLRGVLLGIPTNGKPVDSPEFMPLYERMCEYNLPIFWHPASGPDPNYPGETESKYNIWLWWGWPFETTASMTRLVFSGVMEKYPELKIVTHHAGGMLPFYRGRIEHGGAVHEMRWHQPIMRGLRKFPIEYFKMFYGDTCTDGCTAALMCAYDFFGADHLLFGTDLPMEGLVSISIEAVEQMDIPDSDKKKIFEENAKKLMRLHIV